MFLAEETRHTYRASTGTAGQLLVESYQDIEFHAAGHEIGPPSCCEFHLSAYQHIRNADTGSKKRMLNTMRRLAEIHFSDELMYGHVCIDLYAPWAADGFRLR
ncbi:hypothetical protein ACMFMF_002235 [Clarireedia jacksonii]